MRNRKVRDSFESNENARCRRHSILNRVGDSTRVLLSFEELSRAGGEYTLPGINEREHCRPLKASQSFDEGKLTGTASRSRSSGQSVEEEPLRFGVSSTLKRRSSINAKQPTSISGEQKSANMRKSLTRDASFLNRLDDSTSQMLSFDGANQTSDRAEKSPEFRKPALRRTCTDSATLTNRRTVSVSRKSPTSSQRAETVRSRHKTLRTFTPRPCSSTIGPGYTITAEDDDLFISKLNDSTISADDDDYELSLPPQTDRTQAKPSTLRTVSRSPPRRRPAPRTKSTPGDFKLVEKTQSPTRSSKPYSPSRRPPGRRQLTRTKSNPDDLPSRRNSGGWDRPSFDIILVTLYLSGAQKKLCQHSRRIK